jgi:hypothetical protein
LPIGWYFKDYDDLPQFVEASDELFRRYALPYFETYSTVEKVFELLSSDTRFGTLHSIMPLNRHKKVIALAKSLPKHMTKL